MRKILYYLFGVVVCFTLVASPAFSADMTGTAILYPRPNALVGSRVNLVLDPATDWSTVPFFQVIVNNKTEYPVVDTSSGKHAVQGLMLDTGINSITVRFLVPANDARGKKAMKTVATRGVMIFNREGSFTETPPSDFVPDPFHSRDHEADCSGCHRLDITADDIKHSKPENVLCFACHKNIPAGKHIHGPVAVWDCLACHNPDMYPVKYQFNSSDPWKASKTTQAVEPQLYTISSTELFKPSTASLLSKDKAREMMQDVIDYLKKNPGDKVRIESHTDNVPIVVSKESKKKTSEFKTKLALTSAQARAVASLLEEAKVIPARNITAVGMGDELEKAPNQTREGKEINNRVEIVVYPADVTVKNSRQLPLLADRERVLITLSYAKGQKVRKLSLIEKAPKGLQYLSGSGYFRGKAREPKMKGEQLIWELGDMDQNFSETLSYVVKKDSKTHLVPEDISVTYMAGSKEVTRQFNPKTMVKLGLSVKETCAKCHGDVASAKFKHGPVDAGYCNLCHDPHASPYNAWLRKNTWELCTTCHAEKASGVHVVAGFVSGGSHPTRLKPDPSRPGKRLTCVSCHEPHGADCGYLYVRGIKTRNDLCPICHQKK